MSALATKRARAEEHVSDETYFWASFKPASADNPVVDLTKPEQRIDGKFNIEAGVTIIAVRPNYVSTMAIKFVKSAQPDDYQHLVDAGFEKRPISAPALPAPSKG